MTTVINKSKLASMILMASLSSAAFASDMASQGGTEHSTNSNEAAYWGLGLGSVLGGIIAGPPGVAIGASLGGAFGWGQDQHEALEVTQKSFAEKDGLVRESSSVLARQAEQLKLASTRIGELKRSHQRQSETLDELRMELVEKTRTLEQSDVANVLGAYNQEIYFEKGESQVPVYASERISGLAALLKRYPQIQVNLTGYSDQSGPRRFNQQLSQARAEGVRDALLSEGLTMERIQINSEGEAKANIAEMDQHNAILDRRVAIAFSQPITQARLPKQDEQEVESHQLETPIEDRKLAELKR